MQQDAESKTELVWGLFTSLAKRGAKKALMVRKKGISLEDSTVELPPLHLIHTKSRSDEEEALLLGNRG